MMFQNIEFYETDKYQYLLIHKNASSSILNFIKKDSFKVVNTLSNKIRWTVIRDPYERVISGLSYDLKKQNITISEIDIDTIFSSHHHLHARTQGNVNHSSSQIPYLINAGINWYIDLKDINLFLKMHFGESTHINHNNEVLEINKSLENNIKSKLYLDYFIYDQIKNSPFIWQWQKGRIF